ncbi:sensor histidine kinase [Devosia sp. BSSL-BM10]|uniref:C4-dicarboxylate transport sensor protein DctB n=1 Tax=Devosia litorisediminis TaxID=2829817 RepID=A0A942E7A4_9HYPH|nr:ATP-binding protein [Devosia litorisediminis]MBS3848831.1 sensor histidine kinase [Devosia litorisediminis]
MINGAAVSRRYIRLSTLNALIGLSLCGAAAYFGGRTASDLQASQLGAAAQQILNVQAEALNGALDKYRMLPVMLGHRPDTAALFEPGADTAATRRIAVQAAGISGALDVVFVRPTGAVLARASASVADVIAPDSDLMRAALQGRLGRDERVLADGRRTYVFSSAMWQGTTVIGAVAVYVDLETIEDNWSLINNPILASDASGMVIISNRPAWRMAPRPDFRNTVEGGGANPMLEEPTRYLARSRYLAPLNWTLTVLLQAAPMRLAAALWGGLAAALTLGLTLAVQMLINRNFAIVRRTRAQRANALRLERIVRDRTRELLDTNTSLAYEVGERKAAVEMLRKTQAELVQTGKMAALGQMSTALSHEINQPLSAVKTYAQNALTYLQRGRQSEAMENIGRISELTDRMAAISKHLRNFARKPNPTFGSTTIAKVIEDALLVVSARLREQSVTVTTDLHDAGLLVRGGPVRLQQVMVNLILNALDAMKGQSDPTIAISVAQVENTVQVSVRDNGPGIETQDLDQIFDPFFTTKEVGQGLGLGLSISYNIIKDFGGTLSAHNSEDGGACFVVSLDQGEGEQVAAQ